MVGGHSYCFDGTGKLIAIMLTDVTISYTMDMVRDRNVTYSVAFKKPQTACLNILLNIHSFIVQHKTVLNTHSFIVVHLNTLLNTS